MAAFQGSPSPALKNKQQQTKILEQAVSTELSPPLIASRTERGYIAKSLDTLQIGEMEECSQIYIELQSKLRSNASDEAPVLCALLPEVAKFSEMLVRDVKIALVPNPLNGRQIELVTSCLRCLGFFIHHLKIIEALGAANCNNLLNLLCQVILQASEKHICSLAVWCISSQRLPAALLSQNALILAQALSFGLDKPFESANIATESLNALIWVCKKDPVAMMKHGKEFLIRLLWFAIDDDASIREKAGHMLVFVSNSTAKYQSEYEPVVVDFFKNHADAYCTVLEKLVLPEKRLVKLWIQLVTILDKFLLHSKMLQQLMKLLEGNFNHQNPDTRCLAFHAWERLVELFNKDGYTNNRMHIIMLPLVNTFSNERVKKVRMAAVKLWPKVLSAVSHDVQTFFEEAVMTPVRALKKETEIEIMVYTSRIISNLVLGYTRKPQRNSSGLSQKNADCGFSVEPKWLRSQTEFILDFIFAFNINNSKIYLQTASIWKNLLDNLTQLNISEIQHTSESITAVRQCFTFIQNMINAFYDGGKLNTKILSEFVTGLKKHLGDRIMKSQSYSIPPENLTPQEELKNVFMELHIIFNVADQRVTVADEAETKEYLQFFRHRKNKHNLGHAWHVAAGFVITLASRNPNKFSENLKDIMELLFFPIKNNDISFVIGDQCEVRFAQSWINLFQSLLSNRKSCNDEIKVILNELQKMRQTEERPLNLFMMYVVSCIYGGNMSGLTRPELRSFRFLTRNQLFVIDIINDNFTLEFARIYVKCLIIRWQKEFEALNDPVRADLREMAIQSFAVFLMHLYNSSLEIQKELSSFVEMIRRIWRQEVLSTIEEKNCEISEIHVFKAGLLCRDADIRKSTLLKYEALKAKNPNYTFIEEIEEQNLIEKSNHLDLNERVEVDMGDVTMADEQSSSPLKAVPLEIEETPIKQRIELPLREPLKDRTAEILSESAVSYEPSSSEILAAPPSVIGKRKADPTMDFQSPPSILKKRVSKDAPNKNRRVSFQFEGETRRDYTAAPNEVAADITEFASIDDNSENIDPVSSKGAKESDQKWGIRETPPSEILAVKYDSDKIIADLKLMNDALMSLSSEDLFRLQGRLQTATAQVFTEIQKRFA